MFTKGLHDLTMLLQRGQQAARDGKLHMAGEPEYLTQIADDALQEFIPGQILDRLVKDIILLIIGIDIALGGIVFQLGVHVLKLFQIVRAAIFHRLAGTQALQHRHNGEQLIEFLHVHAAHKAALARDQFQQAFTIQDLQGFTQRRPAYPETFAQCHFIDGIARFEFILIDQST